MSTPFHITLTNFDSTVVNASTPVLVDFWAAWCMPCRMIAPIIEELAEDYEGKMAVGKIDIDECPALAEKFGVMSIPTLILFKDGQPVEKAVGVQPKAQVEQMVEKYL